MGLTIKRYSRSYHGLHILRTAALRVEGIDMNTQDFYYADPSKIKTKFPQFIIHSDCDGIYISKSSKQYDNLYKKWKRLSDDENDFRCLFGDLDELKKEVIELNKSIKNHLSDDFDKDSWDDFYQDVMNARKILEFT